MSVEAKFKTKQLIVKPNDMGIGFDVGWRVYGIEGKGAEIYWGNTKNAQSFSSMVEDARRQGYEFELDETALELLEQA